MHIIIVKKLQQHKRMPLQGNPAILIALYSVVKACSLFMCAALPMHTDPAFADQDETIIIERNVFHPQRKKWLMEYKEKKPDKKSVQEKQAQEKILQQVVLYGTVQSDNREYAIIRMAQSRTHKRMNTVYMVGDYVNGFLIKGIEEQSIILADSAGAEQFEIFVNQGNKTREPLKTALQASPPGPAAQPAGIQKSKGKQAKTAPVIKNNIKRALSVLKSKPTKFAKKQARNQLKQLEALLPGMSYAERREFLDLKNEYERLAHERL